MTNKVKKRLWILSILAFTVYFILATVKQQPTIDALLLEKQQITSKIEQAQKENEELKYLLSIIDTDLYMEKMARSRLGYVKPQDLIFIDSTNR